MTHSRKLFEFKDGFVDVPKGLHLIAGLTGFTDAGATLNQVADHIFANLTAELVVQFKNDELLDYRSRRPVMFFERDHIEHYEPAILGLYLVYDEANQPFLYLHGYEPDFKWEAFAEAILELVRGLEVEDFTWVHSIPFPIPHTRSVGVTVSGNRLDIIDAVSEWKPQTQVPGNVLHLLEYRLSGISLPTVGFVMLVPHYLSESEFPQSAVVAFEQISSATGLVFPTDAIREDSVQFLAKLDSQLEKNEDLQKLVRNLEQGYATESSGPNRAPIAKPIAKMPTAEEIAAELEDYLAIRRRNSMDD
jgi:hypothetical protein